MSESPLYDLIILGAGPAGLAAGLYAGRARLRTLILEKGVSGGQIVNTAEIENYPGQLLEHETGESLTARMAEQCRAFGAEIRRDAIRVAHLDGPVKVLESRKNRYTAKAVLIATGATPKPIGCAGEAEYSGRGVSYCATCDGNFYQDMHTLVAGGGDSAVEEALFLTRFARRVTLVHRRNALRAARSIQEKAFANPKIDFMWDSVIEAVGGEPLLGWADVRNVKTGAVTRVEKAEGEPKLGVFGFVGNVPATALFEGAVEMQSGYIVTDAAMNTSRPGVFAAGDVRVTPLRQVVTACADGAIAATSAEKYIEGLA